MHRSPALIGMMVLAMAGFTACSGGDGDKSSDTESGDTEPQGVCNLSIDPTEYDFGEVDLDSLNTAAITLTNSGDGDCVISGLAVDDPFSLSAEAPLTVSAGSSSSMSVYFVPNDYGDYQSFATFTLDDATEQEVLVVGSVSADADGDGYDTTEAGGNDCDDDDADINPGATEQYYDGVDQNCDGENDFDQDGDGFEACYEDTPDDELDICDCVDVNDEIYPGAPDEWYDGVNSDCGDESDFDQDGDGWTSEAFGGSDCDDTDPTVSVEGTEVFNGKDDDCNGAIDDEAPSHQSWYSIWGTSSTDAVGHSVALGDFDGNGDVDMAIGAHNYNYSSTTALTGDAYGAVGVFMNGEWDTAGDIESGSNLIEGELSTDELGYAMVTVGDWDGSGGDDLAVSAFAHDSRAGKVYVFSGDDLSSGEASDYVLSITGEDDYRIGMGLGGGHDIDGDGTNDLTVYGAHAGMAYNFFGIQYGGSEGDLEWDDMDSTWRYKCGTLQTGSNSWCGGTSSGSDKGGTETWPYNAHGYADFNGDGYSDVVLGDKYYDSDDYRQAGKVWILWGTSSQYARTNSSLDGTATTIYEGASAKNYIGATVGVLPDVDGDGDNELIFSDDDDGVLYYFPGSEDLEGGYVDLDDADAVMDYGETTTAVVNIGDWDGDDVEDFALARGEDGYVMFFYSEEWSGEVDLEDEMDGAIENGGGGQYFGLGIAQTQMDLDGDGDIDLVAGDYGAGYAPDTGDDTDTIDEGTGAMYMYENKLIEDTGT